MAFNIIDFVKEQISDQLLGQIGKVLGTDGSKTSAALGGALPGMLAGLSGAAQRPEGASALFDAAGQQDDGMLGNMGNLLGGGDDTSRVIDQGTSTLGSLLGGGAVGKLGGVLSNFAGISRSGSGSLMGMLAPIVIGAIKRKMSEGNLDAAGLGSLLGEQRSNIDAAMPQGLADQLQSEGFFDSIAPERMASANAEAAPAAAATSSAAAAPTPSPIAPEPPAASTGAGGGLPGWLLPLAAVVVLALVGWFLIGGKDAPEAPDAAVTTETAVTDAATAATDDAAAAVELPAGMSIDGITGEVSDVLGSTAGTLEGITDEASARAALPQLKDATTRLGGLNDVITRLPEAARGPIAAAVSGGLASLQPIADRVLALPAVGPVIEPVLRPMLETLQGLAG